MTRKIILHAIHGFVGTTLLGICLFGIPLALYGAWDAWKEPVVLDGKSRGEERTILGRSTETFCVGAFIGGISGMIAGAGVAAMRLWSGGQLGHKSAPPARSGQVIHMHKTTNSDLTWLVGRQLKVVEKKDYSWFFTFDDGSSIATESFWRLITTDGVAVTSEDHGQQFGLPAPVDAAELAKTKIGGTTVDRFTLDEQTGDLSICFSDKTLQFVTTSAGYEGWRTVHGSQEIVCGGGGRLLEPTE
jgi:hypothetical protein